MESIIQKCPNCGQWIEVEESSVLDKADAGITKLINFGEKYGKKLGGILGKSGEKYGKKLGGFAANAGGGLLAGGLGAVLGDNYEISCPACGYRWSVADSDEDQSKEYQQEIVEVENRNSEIYESTINEYYKCNSKDDYNALVLKSRQLLNEIELTQNQEIKLRTMISSCLTLADRDNEAVNWINDALNCSPENPLLLTLRGNYRFCVKQKSNNALYFYEILADYSNFYKVTENEFLFLKYEEIENCFNESIAKYVENFSTIPPSKRQFVFFKNKIDAVAENVKVLPVGYSVPNIHFPQSHPHLNTLYVLHPLKTDTYIPVDNYEFELFKDQLNEFSWIMEHLGAKKISYNILEDNLEEKETHIDRNIGGEAKVKGVSVGADVETRKGMKEMRQLLKQFEENSSFNNTHKVKMPDPNSLVWYHYNKEWQRKVESRLSGRRERIQLIMSTYSNNLTSESNKLNIEAEVSYLMYSAKGKYGHEKSFQLKKSLSQQCEINVEFYPLESNSVNEIKEFTKAELEYKEEYEACLADGVIGSSERRLLDRFANKLGLSPEQVKRIEESAGNPLTDEEKEYLEEYRTCLTEDPELSASTRRLLSKMAKSLGLTEEQVNKLENLKS